MMQQQLNSHIIFGNIKKINENDYLKKWDLAFPKIIEDLDVDQVLDKVYNQLKDIDKFILRQFINTVKETDSQEDKKKNKNYRKEQKFRDKCRKAIKKYKFADRMFPFSLLRAQIKVQRQEIIQEINCNFEEQPNTFYIKTDYELKKVPILKCTFRQQEYGEIFIFEVLPIEGDHSIHSLFLLPKNSTNLKWLGQITYSNSSIFFFNQRTNCLFCFNIKQKIENKQLENLLVLKGEISERKQFNPQEFCEQKQELKEVVQCEQVAYLSQTSTFVLLSKNNIYSLNEQNKKIKTQKLKISQKEMRQIEQLLSCPSGKYFYLNNLDLCFMFNSNFELIKQIKLNQKSKLSICFDQSDIILYHLNNDTQQNKTIEVIVLAGVIEKSTYEQQNMGKNEAYGNSAIDIMKGAQEKFGPLSQHVEIRINSEQELEKVQIYAQASSLQSFTIVKSDFLKYQEIVVSNLIKTLYSRVPIQLCTIENGSLFPLVDGFRQEYKRDGILQAIDMAKQLSLGYLDEYIKQIKETIFVISIIGKQSSGKSYLLNRLFETRFSVAACRCTDGVWACLSFFQNHFFLLLDCEGLFSSSRTQKEEIQMLAFLTAVSDCTILNQDLTFNRHQLQLLEHLGKASEQLKGKELFQGFLIVVLRDVSSKDNAGLDQEFQDSFLTKIEDSDFFEKIFNLHEISVEPLVNYESTKIFDGQIIKIRNKFIDAAQRCNRWKSGEHLLEIIKLVLCQLELSDQNDTNLLQEQDKILEIGRILQKQLDKFLKQITWVPIILIQKLNPYDLDMVQSKIERAKKLEIFIYQNFQMVIQDSTVSQHDEKIKVINLQIQIVLQKFVDECKFQQEQQLSSKFSQENDALAVKTMADLNSLYQEKLNLYGLCQRQCSFCNLKCSKFQLHYEEPSKKIAKIKKKMEIENKKLIEIKVSSSKMKEQKQELQKIEEEILKIESLSTTQNFENERFFLLSQISQLNKKLLSLALPPDHQGFQIEKKLFEVSQYTDQQNIHFQSITKILQFIQEYLVDQQIQLKNEIQENEDSALNFSRDIILIKAEESQLIKIREEKQKLFNEMTNQIYSQLQNEDNPQKADDQKEINQINQELEILSLTLEMWQNNSTQFTENKTEKDFFQLYQDYQLKLELLEKERTKAIQQHQQYKQLISGEQKMEQAALMHSNNMREFQIRKIKSFKEQIELIEDLEMEEKSSLAEILTNFLKFKDSRIQELLRKIDQKNEEKTKLFAQTPGGYFEKQENLGNELKLFHQNFIKKKEEIQWKEEAIEKLNSETQKKKKECLQIELQSKTLETSLENIQISFSKLIELQPSIVVASQNSNNKNNNIFERETIKQKLQSLNQLKDKLIEQMQNQSSPEQIQNKLEKYSKKLQGQEELLIHSCQRVNHYCDQVCCANDGKQCQFEAGNNGDHLCTETEHFCKEQCSSINCLQQCSKKYGHTTQHLCQNQHFCPFSCSFCEKQCKIDTSMFHSEHLCEERKCEQKCQLCDAYCDEPHSHSISLNLHFCNKQNHNCSQKCELQGICKITYKQNQKLWKGKFSQFTYPDYEQICAVESCLQLIEGKIIKHQNKHACKKQEEHKCDNRCPECLGYCDDTFGHKGHHHTPMHRNKDLQIFTNEIGKTDAITIIHNKQIRQYEIGNPASPEICSESCQRRGRSHFHLIECKGGQQCLETVNKYKGFLRHSKKIYQGFEKQQFDEVLCNQYWDIVNWQHPVSNPRYQEEISLCNFYCQYCGDDEKIFCTERAWHSDSEKYKDHSFSCAQKHKDQKPKGLNICFVIDSTGSMSSYLQNCKKVMEEIIKKAQVLNNSTILKFAIISYTDHSPKYDRSEIVYKVQDFTNHNQCITFINSIRANGGGDEPEAVLDGLQAAANLKWEREYLNFLYLIADAPPHGTTQQSKYGYHSRSDDFPEGCPCGLQQTPILKQLMQKNINLKIIKVNLQLELMIKLFQQDFTTLQTFDIQNTPDLFISTITEDVCQAMEINEITFEKKQESNQMPIL